MDRKQGYAEVNNTRLYYEIAGSGHPLVLVHGFSLDTRMWDAQLDVFAQHYRVLRYDMRGFGRSAQVGSESYSSSSDLKALLDYLGIEQAYVLGLSLGGWVAINFTLTYPYTVCSLICVDSVLSGYRFSDQHRALAIAIHKRAVEEGIPAGRELWLQHPMFVPANEKSDVSAALRAITNDYSGWHWLNDDPDVSPKPPAITRLHEIQVPTLVIVGERDVPDMLKIADILAENIQNARKVVLSDLGHMPNIEDPDRFNDAVLGFLGEL